MDEVRIPSWMWVNMREELETLKDNYKATQELLAIREEQVGELLSEIKLLRERVSSMDTLIDHHEDHHKTEIAQDAETSRANKAIVELQRVIDAVGKWYAKPTGNDIEEAKNLERIYCELKERVE